MKTLSIAYFASVSVVVLVIFITHGCGNNVSTPKPVKQDDTDSLTYLYVISASSDQVVIQSTINKGSGIWGLGYLYWWDVEGGYHRHYSGVTGIVHASSRPLEINKGVIIMKAEKEK